MDIIDLMDEALVMLPTNRYIVVKKCLELAREKAAQITPLMRYIPEPEQDTEEIELDHQVWQEIEDVL